MSVTEYAREQGRARMQRWRANNPEKNRAACRAAAQRRRATPEGRAYANRIRADWAKRHPGTVLARVKQYKLGKIQRTPKWADLKKIEQIYTEAKVISAITGEPWHVDHIVPLRGRRVSGLHVHTNLQLLPGAANVRKGNKYDE